MGLGYHFQHAACELAKVITIPASENAYVFMASLMSKKTTKAKQILVLFFALYGPNLKAIHIISPHISVKETPSHDYPLPQLEAG